MDTWSVVSDAHPLASANIANVYVQSLVGVEIGFAILGLSRKVFGDHEY